MLLYHFPLTSNSATPNLTNKGLRNDYIIGGQGSFVSGGRLSSYCWNNQRNKIQFNIDSSGHYTVCFRYKNYAEQNNWSNVFSMIGSGSNTVSLLMNNWYAMYIDINASQSIYMSYNYNDNKWHDIVVVYSNGQGKIYVDDVDKVTFSASLNVVAIGGRANQPSGFSQNFDCQFQDIRIYSHILTPQEVSDYSKALVLHYPLNGSVKDCSEFGNDYTKNESKSYLFFENSPRYSKYLNTNDESIKAVTTTATTQSKCLWCKNGNDWYFLANNGQKYVNGVVSGQYDTILSNATEISDLRIYASALSQADIQALYKTPITLGNSLNAYEFIETNEQDIKLYKSGVIKANEISESTSNQFSKNGILTTELKEI